MVVAIHDYIHTASIQHILECLGARLAEGVADAVVEGPVTKGEYPRGCGAIHGRKVGLEESANQLSPQPSNDEHTHSICSPTYPLGPFICLPVPPTSSGAYSPFPKSVSVSYTT